MSDPRRIQYVLRLADTSLVLGQRLGEWVGHAPALEEDLGLANISLDLIGQARLLLTYAGELEGRGRTEDDLAYLARAERLPQSLARRAAQRRFRGHDRQAGAARCFPLELYEALQQSKDARLAQIAAKSLKETRYHFRYSSGLAGAAR